MLLTRNPLLKITFEITITKLGSHLDVDSFPLVLHTFQLSGLERSGGKQHIELVSYFVSSNVSIL